MADNMIDFTGLHTATQWREQDAIGQEEIQANAQKITGMKLQNEQTQLTIQRQEAMLRSMSKLNAQSASDPSGQAKQLASQLFGWSQAAMDAGLPEQASQFAERGGKLLDNAATIQSKAAETNIKQWQTISNLANYVKSGSNDQERSQRWQMANMMLPSILPGVQNPFAGKPYNPMLIDGLIQASQTATAQAQIAKDKAQALQAMASSTRAAHENKLDDARTAEANKRTAFIGKQGGKDKLANENQLTNEVVERVKTEYQDDTQGFAAAAKTLSRPVAERAAQLMDQGMGKEQAVNRAFAEAKLARSFDSLKQRKGRSAAFGKGYSSENPAPMPKSQAEAKAGTWYKTPQGALYWDGKKFMTSTQVLQTYER